MLENEPLTRTGSGKSTLMKYLYAHDDNIKHLCAWSNGMPVVRAHFYFWNPGQRMQKTLEGLLQTLLYHILQAYPDLVPALFPGRWRNRSNDVSLAACWTLDELQKALAIFASQYSRNTKFYFHIDGMDEYEGDCWEVIETLQSLSNSPNIKLCLSSRPWNQFQDAFGESNPHKLRLHELTREDIELFARESLECYTRYTDFEPMPFNKLIHDIADRAEGVFLWVRLVVRSLRDGITNEDPVSILHQRLRTIPLDLEALFEQILASVDVLYRTQMANTFVATLMSDEPLRIIHYYFLEQDGATHEYELPANQWPDDEVQRRVQQTQRRLNGRFKGLLEPASTIGINPGTTVDFLHRTLRDFLTVGRMRSMLDSWVGQQTHVLTCISRALIAESKFIQHEPSIEQLKLAIELAHEAHLEADDPIHYFKILDQAEQEYGRLKACRQGCQRIGCMLRAAISIGHTQYVRYRLAKHWESVEVDFMLMHAMTCPLDCDETFVSCLLAFFEGPNKVLDMPHGSFACFPSDFAQNFYRCPSSAMVTLLLDHGANPNAILEARSAQDVFLDRLVDLMDGPVEDQVFEIFEAFLTKSCLLIKANSKLWHRILVRKENMTARASRNTLRYFKGLFRAGLDSMEIVEQSTATTLFLRTLTGPSSERSEPAQNDRNELLREFLQHGADITQIYMDSSETGWLNSFVRFLSRSTTAFDSRIIQLEIFLEHGLNPNSKMPDNTSTMWKHLLGAFVSSLGQDPVDRARQQSICRTITLCLRYGADPHAEKLQEVMDWMKGKYCYLTHSQVLEVQRALKKEIAYANCNVQTTTPDQTGRSPSRLAANGRGSSTPANYCDWRSSHKRSAASPAGTVYGRRSKRSRYA